MKEYNLSKNNWHINSLYLNNNQSDEDSNDEDYKPDEDEREEDDYSEEDEKSDYDDNKKYKNHGKVWTKEDDKYLIKLVILDNEYTHISNYLERTEDAIKARFVKKVRCKRYTKKTLNNNFDLFCKSFNIKRNDMVRYITYVIPSFELKEPMRNRINLI